jgi:integrase
MTSINPANERLKRAYFHHLREAEGLAEPTIDNAARIIKEYEEFSGGRDFRQFRAQDAGGFRRKLLEKGGRQRAELSSRATVRTKLLAMAKFFRWLAGQPGFKSRIGFNDIKHFNLSLKAARVAEARREQPTPTLSQVQHVIRSMPARTDIEKRDRALLACMLLTGIRVGALISLRLKHIRADRLGINQDARDMNVKFSKSFVTYFFPVGDDILQFFLTYVDHVRDQLEWRPDHPLFPRSKQSGGSFEVQGLGDDQWRTPGAVWSLFRRAFATAGVPYHTPHSLRRTLVQAVLGAADDPEMIKILSQNMGHEGVLVTLTSYGSVPTQRQAQRLASLDLNAAKSTNAEAVNQLARALANPQLAELLRQIAPKDNHRATGGAER